MHPIPSQRKFLRFETLMYREVLDKNQCPPGQALVNRAFRSAEIYLLGQLIIFLQHSDVLHVFLHPGFRKLFDVHLHVISRSTPQKPANILPVGF